VWLYRLIAWDCTGLRRYNHTLIAGTTTRDHASPCDDHFGVGTYGRGEDVAVFRVVGYAVDEDS
jgi:hypothetical protein